MNRARVWLPATAGGGIAGTAAVSVGAAWPITLATLAIVLVIASVVCWIIADGERPQRAAVLIAALRDHQPTAQPGERCPTSAALPTERPLDT